MKTLDKFLEYTGYDLEGYLIRIDDFFSSRVNVIVQYYKGVEISNKDVFNELNSLVSESIRISQIIDSNKDILSNDTSFWDILEAVSDVSSQLKTVVSEIDTIQKRLDELGKK